jgi:hypothetical protein
MSFQAGSTSLDLILEGAKIAMWMSTCRPELTVPVLVSALLVPLDALLEDRTDEGPVPLDMTEVFPRLPVRSPRKVFRMELPPADLVDTSPIPEVGKIPIVNLVFKEMGAREILS